MGRGRAWADAEDGGENPLLGMDVGVVGGLDGSIMIVRSISVAKSVNSIFFEFFCVFNTLCICSFHQNTGCRSARVGARHWHSLKAATRWTGSQV
jgi:hypothetical protein